MTFAIVKVVVDDAMRDDKVVYRTNSLDEAWAYVKAHKGENLKIFDTNLNKKYKE